MTAIMGFCFAIILRKLIEEIPVVFDNLPAELDEVGSAADLHRNNLDGAFLLVGVNFYQIPLREMGFHGLVGWDCHYQAVAVSPNAS